MAISNNRTMKCKCKPENIIPPQRVALGYTTCVECSTVQPYGCVQITYHKTGNTIQIMPKEQAKRIRKLSARRGYGTCLKNIWATAETRLKARIDAPIVNVKVQSRCKTSRSGMGSILAQCVQGEQYRKHSWSCVENNGGSIPPLIS